MLMLRRDVRLRRARVNVLISTRPPSGRNADVEAEGARRFAALLDLHYLPNTSHCV